MHGAWWRRAAHLTGGACHEGREPGQEESETIGTIKLLIDEDSGRFLGATMLGIQADEIIQAISLVMASGGTWQAVREALPVHPTVTEFLPTIIDRRKPLQAN
jgi:pyruvate/2-oxoglutarate dehydrogenase complex dihydrolipoamide dehydrogenase (E3) component